MLVHYTLTQYDENREWVVLGQEVRSVELDSPHDFYRWAAETWKAPRWTAELHVGQLGHDPAPDEA
jgi:hypothetical protein